LLRKKWTASAIASGLKSLQLIFRIGSKQTGSYKRFAWFDELAQAEEAPAG